MYSTNLIKKITWSLPWLLRYPFWRIGEVLRRPNLSGEPSHILILVANHYEPALGDAGLRRVEQWCELAKATGDAIRDHDGTPFRHTNFFPAEQYEKPLLEALSSLQADGYCEVEIHLHHGVDQPDTPEMTRAILEEFRDTLAFEHKCLSRESPISQPRYAFVHGNWALANSAGGRYCGVDEEMQILSDTGCYADFTLPSAPDESQVSKINSIYQCHYPLTEAKPHRRGSDLRVARKFKHPVIFEGPLVLDWQRRVHGFPVPRFDDGALALNYPLTLDRFNRWRNAHISVRGRPEWTFVKLYCHAFFEVDLDSMIGMNLRRFMTEVLEMAEHSGSFHIHFVTAREAYNIMAAAVDGHSGNPHAFRNYRLKEIRLESEMQSNQERVAVPAIS